MIAKALEVNKTLRELYLENNQIQDDGVRYICKALHMNTTLKILSLAQNLITDKGVKDLFHTFGLLEKPIDDIVNLEITIDQWREESIIFKEFMNENEKELREFVHPYLNAEAFLKLLDQEFQRFKKFYISKKSKCALSETVKELYRIPVFKRHFDKLSKKRLKHIHDIKYIHSLMQNNRQHLNNFNPIAFYKETLNKLISKMKSKISSFNAIGFYKNLCSIKPNTTLSELNLGGNPFNLSVLLLIKNRQHVKPAILGLEKLFFEKNN